MNVAVPVTVHIGVYRHGYADVFWVMPLRHKDVQHILPARGIGHGYAAYLGYFFNDLVSVPQLVRAGHIGKIRVVYHAGYLQS